MTAVTAPEVIVTHPAMTVGGLPVTIIEIAPTYLFGRVTWPTGGHSYYSWDIDGSRKPTVGDRACNDHPDPLDLDPETLPS